jgi:excisionase family DNA binding protein
MAFLTIDQAAQQFGASVHTLRSVAKSGNLPGARKIGGRWYVHRATLERYFESTMPASPRPIEGAVA